jgi:hypothetical protein
MNRDGYITPLLRVWATSEFGRTQPESHFDGTSLSTQSEATVRGV